MFAILFPVLYSCEKKESAVSASEFTLWDVSESVATGYKKQLSTKFTVKKWGYLKTAPKVFGSLEFFFQI